MKKTTKKSTLKSKVPKKKVSPGKVQKWRPCAAGQYWRSAHYQSTYETGSGKVVSGHQVRAGCCKNPSKKDQIYTAELQKIAKEHFAGLKGPPNPDDLGFHKRGNLYDDLIRGWTQFWNDILQPKIPLDPNVVKALIATESSFKSKTIIKDSPGNGYARGLMQITDTTLKALGNEKGELKDQLIHVTQKEAIDPNLNIAAGTRWLFQKQKLASGELGRSATWDEAVAEYKSVLRKMIKNPDVTPQPMTDFRDYYKKLTK